MSEEKITIKKNEFEGFTIKPEYIEKIIILIESGVFDVEYGSIEINIHNTQFQSVYLNKRTYKRTS